MVAIGGPPFFAAPRHCHSRRTACANSRPVAGSERRIPARLLARGPRRSSTATRWPAAASTRSPRRPCGHVPGDWPCRRWRTTATCRPCPTVVSLLGVPFLLGCRTSWPGSCSAPLIKAVRRRDFSTAGFVVPLCLGALLAHSAVDFDWSYAADFAVVAVLAGLVAGALVRPGLRQPARGVRA